MPSIRSIEIMVQEDSRAHRRLVPLLPQFVALRSLKFWSLGQEDLPNIPRLVELDLAGVVFPSYSRFHAFMANLPTTLRNLKFCNVSWDSGNPDDDDIKPFPRFELDSFDLDWGPRPATEEILFAIRSRRVALAFSEEMVNAAFLNLASRYLRFLGAHLKHLELNCDEQLDQVASVDFSACTGLEVLQISDAVRFTVDTRSNVQLSPDLAPLLSRIAPHCHLSKLILVVQTAVTLAYRNWKPASHFIAILDGKYLDSVRDVEFRVNGTPFWMEGSAKVALEHFEPLIRAAIPSGSTRRIACAEGTDLRGMIEMMEMY
ncbi:hypothetical protein B0H11DRAFT_2189468 [Mycena galericulata]|nr:hypothetical protein B0H11DRAFT_2189468 [Mycena galericulata]